MMKRVFIAYGDENCACIYIHIHADSDSFIYLFGKGSTRYKKSVW